MAEAQPESDPLQLGELIGRVVLHYDLLLVDAELPDGSWMDLLQFVLDSGKSCEVIVCSRCGDERLWAEVIQCGAYGLLVEPYEQQEVLRIIESALRSQHMHRLNGMRMCKTV